MGIIPARGGSKGIPKKNVKLINGKPLIAHTIEQAIESKYINRVIVSTENEEISSVSRKYGAAVPFLRPKELAEDTTPGIEPIIHAVKWMQENEGFFPDYVVCLQCTSPFRKSLHIDAALDKLIKNGGDSIVSVCESEITPYWMKVIKDDKLLNFLEDNTVYARRQDAPEIYRLNGAIYAAKTEFLLKNKGWYDEKTLPYVMNAESSIDIDNILDFRFAEFLMKEGYYE